MKKRLMILLVLGFQLIGGDIVALAGEEYATANSFNNDAKPISEWFIDRPLAESVADEMGVEISYNVSKEDLSMLTALTTGNGRSIRNLKGIEYLKNIRSLNLADNDIEDITELEELMNLDQNIDLRGNKIKDIKALSNIQRLTILNLDNNQITDISPLAGLSVETLKLQNNDISDISELANLDSERLVFIDLWNNSIMDVSPLKGLSKLKYLYLSDNNIRDISPLQNLELTELYAYGQIVTEDPIILYEPFFSFRNPIIDISGIQVDPDLNSLSIGGLYNDGYFDWKGLTEETGISFRWNKWHTSKSAINAYFGGSYAQPYTLLIPEGTIEVTYRDDKGNQLAQSEFISGSIGESFEAEQKEIFGWIVKVIPENAKGVFKEEPQVVSYIYERPQAADVTIMYLDDEGNELLASEVLQGRVGETFTTKYREIKGWSINDNSQNIVNGTFSEEAQIIQYIYEPSNAAPVIVMYTDRLGMNIISPELIYGKIGGEFKTEKRELKGWKLVREPDNVIGIFLEESQLVRYEYEREVDERILLIGKQEKNKTKFEYPKQEVKNNTIYPKTGESSGHIKVIGVSIMLLSVGLYSLKKYK